MMRIACYGEGLIDFTQQGNAFVPHPGGSPYNVAVALARLGCRTEFCSQLSTDMFGQQLVDYLQQNNVGTSHILRSQAPSTLAFVATPENAEPEYAFFHRGRQMLSLNPVSHFRSLRRITTISVRFR